MSGILPRDDNHVTTVGFESTTTPGLILPGKINQVTGRILTTTTGGGDVVGPASATNDNIPVYDGITGKLIKNSTKKLTDLAPVDSVATSVRALTTQKGGVIRAIDSAVGDIARTTDGWIEDERFGIYFRRNSALATGVFDSAVKRTGRLTLRLSTNDASGGARAATTAQTGGANLVGEDIGRAFPIKPSTVYRLRCAIKTNNVISVSVDLGQHTADGTRITEGGGIAGNAGTNDWQLFTATITTNVNAALGRFRFYNTTTGNISDAWFDINSMTLEEVTTVTNPDITPALLIPTFTAVTSVDNIGQATDPTGAFPNTYSLLTAIDETATHRETFTPVKKYQTRYGVFVVARGTGNLTMTVHTAANVVVASATILNANLVNGQFNYFDVPYIFTTGAHHIHVTSTVADATLKVNTASDLETSSFIMQYAKKSENFTVATDTETLQLTSDQDGILSGAVIDLEAGTYNKTLNFAGIANLPEAVANLNNFFEVNSFDNNQAFISNRLGLRMTGNNELDVRASGSVVGTATIKVNTILPIKNFTSAFKVRTFSNADTNCFIDFSTDNINWTVLHTITNTGVDVVRTFASTIQNVNTSIVYLRLRTAGVSANNVVKLNGGTDQIVLSATLDTTPVTFPTLAPGVNNVFLSANSLSASSDQDPSLEMSAQLDAKTLSLIDVFRELSEVSQRTAAAVLGPVLATDNAIVRFDGIGGKAVQNSPGVIIEDNGNVGIGDTSPDERLSIIQDNIDTFIRVGGSATNEAGVKFSHGGIAFPIPKTAIIAKGTGTFRKADLHFVLDSVSDSNPANITDDTKMVILNNGNVGIGANAPAQKLTINGGIQQLTATARPTCDVTNRGTTWHEQGGAGVKDTYAVCAKDAADAYAWRAIY